MPRFAAGGGDDGAGTSVLRGDAEQSSDAGSSDAGTPVPSGDCADAGTPVPSGDDAEAPVSDDGAPVPFGGKAAREKTPVPSDTVPAAFLSDPDAVPIVEGAPPCPKDE